MLFVKRDTNGKICEIANTEKADWEAISPTHPEVLDFLGTVSPEGADDFLRSDLAFIRVLEDLIDVLMQKNIISITDFPQPVIDKLLERQSIRNLIRGSSGMELYDED